MRLFHISLALIILLSVIFIPIPRAHAQTSSPSTGCAALNATTVNVNPSPYTAPTDTYAADEVIILKVTGSGTQFTLTHDGAAVSSAVLVGQTIIYTIPSDGTYTFGVAVEGTTDSTTFAEFFCSLPGDLSNLDPDGDGTVEICHIPPGNPGAAHTIRVGIAAVYAHLGHGDLIGRCPADLESRDDNYEDGVVTFVDELSGVITIYGACVQDECFLLLNIDLTILIPINGGEFEFDSDYENAPYVIIYYLGRSHLKDDVHVFQLNLYSQWNELLEDTLLIFMDEDGKILGWDNRFEYVQRSSLNF